MTSWRGTWLRTGATLPFTILGTTVEIFRVEISVNQTFLQRILMTKEMNYAEYATINKLQANCKQNLIIPYSITALHESN
jgi:hypothetical protein